jgi:hypothetical protein
MDAWIAYHSIEPFWFDRLHYQLAHIASAIGNWMGAKCKPSDFLLEEEDELGPDEAVSMLRGLSDGGI